MVLHMIPERLKFLSLSRATYIHPILCVQAQLLICVGLFVTLMDCSPLDSSVHGILQARILEVVAISFSGGSS